MHHDLQDLIKQMKAALQEATADAESAEEIIHHGFDGQLLSKSSGRCTYQFTLHAYWDVDDNAKIVVRDLMRTTEVDARVISHEATSLMLVTSSVLAPEYLPHLLLVEDKIWLLKKQLQALGNLRETVAELGAKTLGLVPVKSGTKAVRGKLGNFKPHPHQERAIAHGLGSEKTLIVGPPGTGKTTTLSDLICRYLQQGLSVLVVSHTNIATDNAFIHLVQAMLDSQEADLRSLIERGLVVRAGEPRHMTLRQGMYRGLTANALADARTGQRAEESARLEQIAHDLEKQIEQAKRDLRTSQQAWQSERDHLLPHIEQLERELLSNQKLQKEQEEKDHIYFATQADIQAKAQKELEKLAGEEHRLNEELSRYTRRQQQHARQLNAATKELEEVQAMGWWKRTFSKWHHYDETAQAALIEEYRQDWVEEGQKIAKVEVAITTNQFKQSAQKATLSRSENEERARRDHFKRIPSPYVKKIKQLEQQLAQFRADLEERELPVVALKAEIETATSERARVKARLAAISAEQEAQWARIITEAQLIATTITSAYLNPRILEREFDVVVVDELSMISVIGVLLVVSRALKHVVGAGDPMQLPPVVVLRHEEQARLAREWLGKNLFSHLDISIFDAIDGAKECVLLTEQGRSHPAIIAPINHYVYQDILTSRAETMYAPAIGPHPEWPLMLVDTTGSKAKCIKPSREKPRENTYHACLAVTIAQQVLTSLPPLSPEDDPTLSRVAIITPYRSQVNLTLRKLREAKIAHQVHVGTINTVQSLEFPVVIFDVVEAPGGPKPWKFTFDTVLDERNMPTGATQKLTVAWTRAKQKLIVIAHRKHLQGHLPHHARTPARLHRLLWDLIEWTAREGYTSSAEYINPDLSNEEQK